MSELGVSLFAVLLQYYRFQTQTCHTSIWFIRVRETERVRNLTNADITMSKSCKGKTLNFNVKSYGYPMASRSGSTYNKNVPFTID